MADVVMSPRIPEGLIRGQNFALLELPDNGVPTTVVLGLVKSFDLVFGGELSRYVDLSGGYGYVEQPVIGKLDISRIVGPPGLPALVCNCEMRNYLLAAGTTGCVNGAATTTSYTLVNAKILRIAIAGTADDWLINYTMSLVFSDLR